MIFPFLKHWRYHNPAPKYHIVCCQLCCQNSHLMICVYSKEIMRYKGTSQSRGPVNSKVDSDNGLSLNRHKRIIWTNDGIIKFTDMRHSASMSYGCNWCLKVIILSTLLQIQVLKALKVTTPSEDKFHQPFLFRVCCTPVTYPWFNAKES